MTSSPIVPPATSDEGGRTPEETNLPAQLAFWFALLAPALLVFGQYLQLRGRFLAIPILGLAATTCGAIGVSRARRLKTGMPWAVIGLLGGIAILVLSAAVVLYIWAASRSNWEF